MAGEEYLTDRVAIKDASGAYYNVPRERLQDVLGKGFQLLEPEELRQARLQKTHGDLGGQITSGALGAASTLTFGGSDVALVGLGADKRNLRNYEEANPKAYMAGQITGAVAPAIFTGGGSVAAQGAAGAAKLGAGQLAKAGAKTALRAAGAPVRAAARAGIGLEKLVAQGLKNQASKSLVRKVAANAVSKGAGAALEGGLFGAGQVIHESAVGDTPLTGEQVASTIGLSALFAGGVGGGMGLAGGLTKAAFKGAKAGAEKVGASKIAKEAIEGEIQATTGGSTRGFQRKTALRASHATPANLKKVRNPDDVADALMKSREELGGKGIVHSKQTVPKALEEIQAIKDKAGKAIGESLEQLDSLVGAPSVSARRAAARIRKEVIGEFIDTPGYGPIRDHVEKMAQEMEGLDRISLTKANKYKTQMNELLDRVYGKVEKTAKNDAQLAIVRVFKEEIDDVAEEVARNTGMDAIFEGFKAAKKEFADLSEAQKIFQSGADRIANNRGFSLTDYITGSAGAAALGPAGLALPIANKVARERGNMVLASIAKEVADRGGVVQFVKGMEGLNKVSETAARRMKTAISALGKTKQRFPAAATVATREHKHEVTTDKINKIRELAANPEALDRMIEQRIQGLAQVAPEASAAAAMAAHRGMDFLVRNLPSPPISTNTLGSAPFKDWDLTPEEKGKAQSWFAAIQDPISVLENIPTLGASPEAVDALREVYPELYNKAVDWIAESYEDIRENAPYNSKVALTILTGVPFDDTLAPEMIGAIQAAYGTPEPGQSEPAQSSVGPGPLEVADRAKTTAERLSARG